MPTKPDPTGSTAVEPPDPTAPGGDHILDVRDLSVHFELQGNAFSRLFGLRPRTVRAVDGIDLRIGRGEVVGLVGESGSGKTTLGRALLGLVPATDGSISYHGQQGVAEVTAMRGAALRQLRTDLQMVFQDPTAALNPSMTIAQAVEHPLVIHGWGTKTERATRVAATLERVGLSPVDDFLDKYPADLSGGQKQRAVIARAIILEPEVLIADEPISMLDMSVRAKILQLMLDLKRDLGLTYVYITHDLASAKYFCDRIAIMYLGRIVEIGPTEEIFANPRHPYTRALLAAIPDPDPDRSIPRDLPRGEIPDAAEPPSGCSFHPRCPVAVAECGWEARDLKTLVENHWTRRTPEEYAAESAVVGSLDDLSRPEAEPRLGRTGAAPARELLGRIREEDPDEPLWRGVQGVVDDGDGVRVEFRDGSDPQLRPAGGVQVACHLYPEETDSSTG
ncbi:ABC transporter ATP-binding protein [Nocardioides sambongensis]|uniref:ABC transporter ATP-binding protein n=1 Tax=Nocardioides sambongensis TaxID=2589074 RepID=UPI001129B918|nr:ABC transporter ATP-binding protein [Nocardioides sambongensis]